jgi:hypothetical protein
LASAKPSFPNAPVLSLGRDLSRNAGRNIEVEYTFTTVNPKVFTIQVKAAVGTTVTKAFNDVGDTCQKLCKDYPVTPVTGPALNAQGFFQSVTNYSDLAETQQYFSDIINISFGRDWKA